MQYADEQKAEFKKQFSRKKRSQFLVAVPVIVVIVLLNLWGKQAALGIPVAVVGPVAFVLVLGALAFSLFNWRCPACNKYLGKAISPKFCSNCGVELS